MPPPFEFFGGYLFILPCFDVHSVAAVEGSHIMKGWENVFCEEGESIWEDEEEKEREWRMVKRQCDLTTLFLLEVEDIVLLFIKNLEDSTLNCSPLPAYFSVYFGGVPAECLFLPPLLFFVCYYYTAV